MKNNAIIFLVFISCLIFSCNKKDRATKQILKQWIGKEIIFPPTLRTQIFNQDTNCNELLKKDFKILLHVDPNGCSECKLKLFKWLQIINTNKQHAHKLAFTLVINTPNMQHIRVMAIQNKFNHPIFYDINGKMDEINQFPKDEKFRCFLLDRNNNVLFVGNPVDNPQLWNLYEDRIKQDYKK